MFFEYRPKVRRIFVSRLPTDLRDALIRLAEQHFCLQQPFLRQVLHRPHPGFLTEHAAKMLGGYVAQAGKLPQADLPVVVFVHINQPGVDHTLGAGVVAIKQKHPPDRHNILIDEQGTGFISPDGIAGGRKDIFKYSLDRLDVGHVPA